MNFYLVVNPTRQKHPTPDCMYILCPTDFSLAALEAADVAALIAKKRGLPLLLLHSMSQWTNATSLAGALTLGGPADEEELETEARRLRTTGVEVITNYRVGSPLREVTAATKIAGAEMVVVGSSPPTAGIMNWLSGSVGARVAEHGSIPTLIARRPDVLTSWLQGRAPLRVLCATDLTLASEAAIAALKQLASLGTLRVEAAHIMAPGVHPVSASGEIDAEAKTNLMSDVWQQMHGVLGDIPIWVHIRVGNSHGAETMARLASELDTGLVVVGTRQLHGLRRLLASSFSSGVLSRSKTNMLCVPLSSYHPDFRVPQLRRILVALSLSKGDAETVRYACSLLPDGGTVRFIHVCPTVLPALQPALAARLPADTSRFGADVTLEAEESLLDLIPESEQIPKIKIESEVLVHTDLAQAILEAADVFGADAICVGSPSRSRLGAAVLGSVTHAVMSKAHQPVVVVPHAGG